MKTVYYNGEIITMNDNLPFADAIVIEDGIIKGVGSMEEIKPLIDDSAVKMDLGGKTLLPGFIDGHSHIGAITASLPTLYPAPAGNVNSKEDLKKELKRIIDDGKILENGWLLAIGYDNGFFENEEHPTRAELDEISIDIPMLVLHASGHVGTVNSKAIEVLGWTKETPNPAGGIIRRDEETGELNGIIEEKAVHIAAFAHAFLVSKESLEKMFIKTQSYYAGFGITTAQEGGTTEDIAEMLQSVKEKNKFIIDVVSYPIQEYASNWIVDNSPEVKYDRHFKVGGAKVIADGSPQAKTAWLTRPYYKVPANEKADYCGYPVFSDEQMYQFCKECIEHKWQLLVHCNGDAASDQFIRTYKKAMEDLHDDGKLRPVMVHAQTVREDQLDVMKEIGMMPSFFHDHIYYWGDYHMDSVLGPDRGSRISPLKSAVKRDMKFTLHNDYAVTPPNIIFDIHNAVNRKTRAGRDIGPEFAIDVMDALKAVTIYGAYQYFDEDIKGSLEVGKMADLVILNKNPLKVPKENIQDIQVLETIKEGNTIFKRK